jgi:hypothetical protein
MSCAERTKAFDHLIIVIEFAALSNLGSSTVAHAMRRSVFQHLLIAGTAPFNTFVKIHWLRNSQMSQYPLITLTKRGSL